MCLVHTSARVVCPGGAPVLQIVRHVEAWDVSALQALLLLLRPSERAVWRGGARG